MNYGNQAAKSSPAELVNPIIPQIVERFDKDLSVLWNHIEMIENRCHKILNLRVPVSDEKNPVPMDNDFIQSMGSRLISFENANQKLSEIAIHLDKII
jgi:hypothetical protein